MANKLGRTELFGEWMGGHFVVADEGQSTGHRFWVHSGTGTDGAGYGRSPDAPFATLAYAFSSDVCTANKNDIIYVMPGHAESLIAAGTVTADIAGVSIVGLGNGENRPIFTMTTAATATFLVSAVNVRVVNLVFKCNIHELACAIDVNADDCTIEACELREGTFHALAFVDINGGGANAADRCKVKNCLFYQTTAGGAEAIEIGAVEDGVEIRDCYIYGNWTGAGIHSASILTNLLLARNMVTNLSAGQHAIELSDAATGMLIDNRLYGNTIGTILDPGSCFCAGNLETDAIDQAGVDSPRTSAGGFPADSITAVAIATDAVDADALAADAVTKIGVGIADGVTDEALSGHVTAGTVGASLALLNSGTAQAGAAGTITLAAAASATNDVYNGGVVQIIGGTGVGQTRSITDYTGGTKIANIVPNWGTNPDNTSVYVVRAAGPGTPDIADAVADEVVSGHVTAGTVGAMLQPLHSGTAQAGAAGTIQLAAAASATNDLYNGATVQIIAGTGVGQTRLIYDYTGGTTTADVIPNWATNPANDSVYVVLPQGPALVGGMGAATITAAAIATNAVDADALAADAVAEIADGVTDEVITGHITAATLGAMLQPLDSGAAQAGAAGTITLAATASATNDLYNGCVLQIISGTGVGQARRITDYDGGTKIATVQPNWLTNPAAASIYVIQPFASTEVFALGTDGTTVTDSATSVLGAIGANSADNSFNSATVTVNRDGSVLERLEHLAQAQPMCIEKVSDVPNASDPLFNVTGGPIEIVSLNGIVTTTLVGALNCHLDAQVTTPAATVALSTNVALDNDAAGTSYSFPAGALPVLTPTDAGLLVNWAAEGRHFMPIGDLHAHYSAVGGGGVIKWYLVYRPLSPNSVVVAAA